MRLTIVIAILCTLVWTITAAPKPSPNDPQAVLDSLRREIDRIDRELEARQSREQDVLRDAAAARQRAALIEQMIHNQSTQVDGLRDSIAALESEIAPRNAELADLGTRLIGLEDEQQRIAASLAKSFLVERRLTGWASLEFLLGSRSWRELLARRELLKRLQTVERHSLTALNSVKDSLQLTEGAIFESARNLRERQSDLEQSRGLAAAKEETYRADLQKLDAEKSELQDRLSDLRRERKSLSARRKEVSKAQREIGHMIDRATERAPLAGTSLDLRKGSLPWPVDGQVVERFGLVHNRKLDTVTENPGIELSTAADASVTSVADGRVSSVTWLRGYGTVCIVEHPGSIYTVYAKLDKVVVKANESIKSGALLGQPAYDAGARDYRVHFEVWSGKEKKDPIEWLQAR